MNANRTPIYFCIDSLLDTRLGTLAKMDDDFAFYALLNGYMDRWTDDPEAYLPTVDADAYWKAYAERDIETLKRSHPTDHALDAHALITDLEERHSAGDPTVQLLPVIHVNYYPYKLTPEQVVEMTKSIRAIIHCRSEVKLISIPTEKLTTEYFAMNGYGAVYMYNYKEWVEKVITERINNGVKFQSCPEVVFYFPALTSSASALEVYAECEREFGRVPNACESLRLLCARFFGLEWVSPTYYSISPTILFPDEKQKEPPEPSNAVADKYLFDADNPADLAKLYSTDGEG